MKTWLKNIGLILLVSLVFAGTVWFLPNELNFKIQNFRGNFAQARRVFPRWKLLAENNELGKAYEQKNYSAVEKNLAKILQTECSLDQKVIPATCENIFYLAGITDYRLGEKLSLEKQKPLFEKAIYEFEKVLAINPQNTWAKENIAFILKNFAEKQQAEKQKQQQQNQQNKDQKNGDKSQNSQDQKGSSEQKNQDDQKSGKGQNNQNKQDQKSGKENSENSSEQNKSDNSSAENKENPAKNSDNSQDKQKSSDDKGQSFSDKKQGENSAKSDSQAGSSNQEKSNPPAPSRLPQNIEQALEQAQQDLEQNKNQQGFNRSRSAAEKDKNSRDPFFDDFFGNDPFFGNFFGGGQKHFNRNITDPNEKDW